jgi:hypothetical protein
MGYFEHLKALLEPMRVYELNSGSSGAELKAIGSILDGIDNSIGIIERECTIGTAENLGLKAYEELLPQKPVDMGLAERRTAISSLLAIDGTSFTKNRLNLTLSGCGISAVVEETPEHYTVEVSFPENRGIPAEIEKIKERIEEILPCHLECRYKYVFCSWQELESNFGTFEDIEAKQMTWEDMETFR